MRLFGADAVDGEMNSERIVGLERYGENEVLTVGRGAIREGRNAD